MAEGWVTLSDGKKLYEKVWQPSEQPPSAHLVFLHGFSDHCNCYYNFFPTLSSPQFNISVHAIDQRGWGRSVAESSEKGLTGDTQQVLQDVHDYVCHVWNSRQSASTNPGTPFFLMGHSMGGQIALHYLLSKFSPYNKQTTTSAAHPVINGLLLEAPYIALDPSSQPSAVTVTLGRLVSKLLPHHHMVQKLDAGYMSRSPKVCEDWVADPLCHDTGTLQGLAAMLDRAAQLDRLSRHQSVTNLSSKLPTGCALWLGYGTGDRVTSGEASRRLFDVLEVGTSQGDDVKVVREYDGAYHKLHAEPDGVGEAFARDVGSWVAQRAKVSDVGDGEVKAKL